MNKFNTLCIGLFFALIKEDFISKYQLNQGS